MFAFAYKEENNMIRLILIAVIQSVFLAGAQLLLKLGLNKLDVFSMSWNYFKGYVSWQIISAVVMFIVALILWLYMLKNFKLSLVYPLTSISYIFTMILAIIFLKETVSWMSFVGVVLIMAGVALLAC